LSKNQTKYGAKHVEEALKRLAPGGRLVAIVGKGMAGDKPAFKAWWRKIQKEYNVRANVGASGAGYAKYGTTFDNQLIIIDKTGPTTDNIVTGNVDRYYQLIPLLNEVRDARTRPVEQDRRKPAGETGTQKGEREAGQKPPVQPATDDVGDRGRAPDTEGQPPTVTGGSDVGVGTGGRLGFPKDRSDRQPAEKPTADQGTQTITDRPGGRATGTAAPAPTGATAGVLRTDQDLSIDELSDLIDEVAAEEGIIDKPKKPKKKPSLKKATKHAAKGTKKGLAAVADIIKGIGEEGQVGGDLPPLVHPEAYAQAKQHLAESYQEFIDANNEVREWVRYALVELKKLGASFEISKNWVLNFYANDRPGQAEPEKAEAVKVKAVTKKAAEKDLGEALFEEYTPAKLSIPGAKEHPTPLVESAAMAAVDPPAPGYSPKIPNSVIKSGKLSLAQLEQVVYAGQAHNDILPNGERRGYFIGDGTGVGKGREIVGILWDNWNNGRKKAVWVSNNFGLLKDAKRDMKSAGWDDSLIFPMNQYKHGEKIRQKEGVLFVPYTTIAGLPEGR
jgi:hypothetical protein